MPEARVAFAVPGDPDAPTGGYGYDRRVARELRQAGWSVDWLRLPDGFPHPGSGELDAAYAALASVPADTTLLVDGLALGAMPDVGRAIGARRALVALVHHPLALESGLAPARAAALREGERAALAAARRVVTTSRATAATLVAHYGVPCERVVVAPPGSDPAPPATGGGGAAGPRLLSVGALVPRKGHDRLIAALARLRALDWRLVVVGDDRRDPRTAAALRAAVREAGLDGRVAFAGAIDAAALDAAYAEADVFVLASLHEGYGMACAEAVARGLPVVATDAGGLPEAVPDGAGLRVPPGDVDALADALRAAIADPATRAALAAGARRAAAGLPRWPETAARVARALREAA